MIVRTYGRRNRGISRTFSDSLSEPAASDSFSQETTPSQDFYGTLPFSSQESSSFLSSSQENNYACKNPLSVKSHSNFDFDDSENGAVRRSKKQKQKHSKKGVSLPWIAATSTLMEAQEFGEMMEHVDEVNFALDGLRKGQPLRIRRASLLSLLSICSTAQQRRLLRSQGMAETIIDAILGLSFDDIPSNLAAVAVFYILTSDDPDEHHLESRSCLRFLIKLLKPVVSAANEDKTQKVGYKLLAIRKDADTSRDSTKMLNSSSATIMSKVKDILVNCKEMKSSYGDDSGLARLELSPKWIALLTMEKACLSKISFEDATGTVRKTGGNFKEKLREVGGLDAVFEVAMDCHSVMEGWIEHRSSFAPLVKRDKDMQSLALLLKCLKIMENATFLSKDNQSHLLAMKGRLDSCGSRLSFTKVVISVIKILSELYLLKGSCSSSSNGNGCSNSHVTGHAPESNLVVDNRVVSHEVISISSSEKCSSMDWDFSEKSYGASQNDPGPSTSSLGCCLSGSETTSTSMDEPCSLKMRINSSFSSSCGRLLKISNGSRSRACGEIVDDSKDYKCLPLDDCQDPFAFDEDEFEPSKWELLSGKPKISRSQIRGPRKKEPYGPRKIEPEYGFQNQLMMSQQESSNGEICLQESINEEYRQCHDISGAHSTEKENSSLLFDCLLTAVKVLMNLTNDNPIGCEQIATCGALETMSSLIANHFPSFWSSLALVGEKEENSLSVELDNQNDKHLTDQELDFLVAILGLLVNLVEKDGKNRSRLAAATISLPNSEGFEEESHRDVISLLCAIFLANRGAGDAAEEVLPWNDDEAAVLQGEKEAEKMIVEAYAALLLAFLSTESKGIRNAIASYLPNQNLAILVPVLERFVAFHLSLNMISPETHIAVSEVIESCRIP